MTESASGVFGGRSSCQSKRGSITTDFGIAAASSESSGARSSSSPPVGSYGCTLPLSNRIGPSIDFAYGSISSFAELKRWPFWGSYGPWTRKP